MDQIEHLESQAVEAAIHSNWVVAIEINKSILQLDAKNVQALLRLGFAYLQKTDYERAKKSYKKALRIQPKQSVAHQYLERISVLERAKIKPQTEKLPFDPGLFIEALGKTKSIMLTNLGQKQVLAHLCIGQPLQLKIKKRRVEMRTESDEYIGALPDDLSKRLIQFIKAKCIYSAYIKESTLTKVIAFIREEKKGKALSNHVSFPQNTQKNIDQIANLSSSEQQEEHEDTEELNDWEKIATETTEEKDENLPIHTEDLDDEDEE